MINKKFKINILILIIIITLIYLIKIFNNSKLEMFHNKLNYVFWTGGYDSTFRICELLIIYRLPVKPIYILYNLDSKNINDKWVRQNRENELKAMNSIRNLLKDKFPFTKHLFYNTEIINEPIISREFDKNFDIINLWPRKRKVHQYRDLAKLSFITKKYIDIGVLGIHLKSYFINFLKKNLIKYKNNYILKVNKTHPLHYIKFPLFSRSKKDLCKIAIKYNFDDILRLSWSCWFPKDSKPCGKCPMCKERFNCLI